MKYEHEDNGPSIPVSPKRRNLEKNFIKKNMAKVIFPSRGIPVTLPPSPDHFDSQSYRS